MCMSHLPISSGLCIFKNNVCLIKYAYNPLIYLQFSYTVTAVNFFFWHGSLKVDFYHSRWLLYRERNFKFIFHVPAKIERKKNIWEGGGGIVGHKGSAKLPVSKMIRKYGVGWGEASGGWGFEYQTCTWGTTSVSTDGSVGQSRVGLEGKRGLGNSQYNISQRKTKNNGS